MLVSLLTFTACNLDAGQGIFSAISESEPSLDTTNQSILGFDGNYVFIKAQDGVYKYGQSNSDVERLNLSLTTNGFATTIGDVVTSTEFIYQDRNDVYQKYDITQNKSTGTLSLADVKAMNNGYALTGKVKDYKAYKLSESLNSPISLNTGSAGIMFGFTDGVFTTMINEFENSNGTKVYKFQYYWDNQEITIETNTDLGNLVPSYNYTTQAEFSGTDKTNFIRIQAYQPPTETSCGVVIAKIANDSYTSLIFAQDKLSNTETPASKPLKYVGQSGFYLNYYSSYGLPSARVEIGSIQYMLVPYSSGLRLIDLASIDSIKKTAIDEPSNYAYASSNTTSFARGFNYNNVVDIKPIPNSDASVPEKNKYLVSTVNSGVYTITLPSAVGTPSDETTNGSREIGYQPIPTP